MTCLNRGTSSWLGLLWQSAAEHRFPAEPTSIGTALLGQALAAMLQHTWWPTLHHMQWTLAWSWHGRCLPYNEPSRGTCFWLMTSIKLTVYILQGSARNLKHPAAIGDVGVGCCIGVHVQLPEHLLPQVYTRMQQHIFPERIQFGNAVGMRSTTAL